MDGNLSTIRLELGINASKFIQQVQIHNQLIEDQIEKGVNLALDEICNNDNFVNTIKEATIAELRSIVHKSVFSWEVKSKIEEMINAKIHERVKLYADQIAEKVTSTLKVN